MGLKKGQCNNLSGRKVGSKNKATTDLKVWVRGLLETNTELFEKDLSKVKPIERLNIMQGLLKYSIPTLSSTTYEAQIKAEYDNLKELLDTASDEAIEKISNKIINLNKQTENE